jgi:CelD/BcsL family acetyltransferase involved in cellulose biosynthesis
MIRALAGGAIITGLPGVRAAPVSSPAGPRLRPVARAEVIEDLDVAERLVPSWDALAVACALPLCAPGWMLSWWRHLAPGASELRLLAVRDGSELLALAPWFVQRGAAGRVDVRFLGAEISDRVDVLCLPGREREAAQALGEALRGLRPRPDLVAFEAVPAGSRWTRRLAGARFGRYRNSAYPAPAVTLPDGKPEDWLAARSSNFRGQMGRMRRRLEKRGGRVRHITDPGELQDALGLLLALHAGRWEGRGESGLTRPGVAELLSDAGRALGPERLRLWAAEIDGQLISVQLFLAAGGEVKYWNGGWSEEHADLKPSMLTILAALEDAIARGERRLDLGVGEHAYKMRFADGADTLTWGGLVVRNGRWPRTRAELAPRVARYRAKRSVQSLPFGLAERVEALARRSR